MVSRYKFYFEKGPSLIKRILFAHARSPYFYFRNKFKTVIYIYYGSYIIQANYLKLW